jgi:diguanylate cyclase (GGDEF)-like protein
MNEAAYKILFPESGSGPLHTDTRKVKRILFTRMCNKNDRKILIRNLRSRDPSEADFDTPLDTADGKRYFNISLSPIVDRMNKKHGKMLIMKDVTEYKIIHNNLQRQLETDFLTGVYNKMFFNKKLDQEIERSRRYNEALSLIMIDIDDFKEYNDLYGHLDGDRLLKRTANILEDNIRNDIDVVARFGGDEFSIILINTDIDEAIKIAERMLACYNNIRFNKGNTSLSIGVCWYSTDMGRDTFIKRTDEAMYIAKRKGGNNISTYSPLQISGLE